MIKGEDTWAVIVGGSLIAMALLGSLFFVDVKFPTAAYQWSDTKDLGSKVFATKNLVLLSAIAVVFFLLSSLLIAASGKSVKRYAAGFAFIFLLAVISLVIAGNKSVSAWGVEYVVFGLLIGLLLNNLFKLPGWIKDAARSEFFIKTGLIILGTSVLLTDIIKAGLPGILQSVMVVAAVWFFSLWLSRKLKVDDEFGVILASAVSICGVSAAIVAAGAINGDKKKLSYVTTLVLLVAIPMMILMPWAIKYFNIPEVVGGAWLGGTLDTTASVAAATELVGPAATKAGVIVKFSQNVLIGVAAFFIAGWWIFKKTPGQSENAKPSVKLIWEKFPKFVLGFICASILFSFVIPSDTGKQLTGFLNTLRTVWFALAFVCIGLEARFADLFKVQEGRPALVFVSAQLFNIIWTLIWAYLLFGGILFPSPVL